MRLFAAMLLPVEAQEHLDEHLDAIRASRPDLRWSPPDRWHLTLQFLGECGPYEVDKQLERWARRAARGHAMSLHLVGAGTFPHVVIARTLWAGVGGDLDSWRRVAAADQLPHVTLARTRERADLTGLVTALEGYHGPPFEVGQIAVMESRLHVGRGPRYQPVEFFELGDGNPAGGGAALGSTDPLENGPSGGDGSGRPWR